jgi:riboflavin kinase/FMN adenylyltransferase
MQLVDTYGNLPPDLSGGVIVLGNFDGVHLGHRTVIAESRRIAGELDVPTMVLTFEPHPRSLFAPDSPPFRLTPASQKARLLAEEGVDGCIMQKFDREFSRRTAESFVQDVLIAGLAARHVVVGYDFKFGNGREGDYNFLRQNASRYGFGVTQVAPFADAEGLPLSSTRVRQALVEGDLGTAQRILGRRHEIEGEVFEGDRRGRTIGFPTANIRLGECLRPRFGVYAVEAVLPDGRIQPGVANVGARPTVDGKDERLEVHLFDFDGDLYGKRLSIRLCSFIRPEQKFSSLDELKSQIARDADTARRDLLELASASR